MNKFTKIIIVFSLIAVFLPRFSFAANVFLSSNKSNFAPNEDFSVQVLIDTQNKTTNAVEGVLTFPSNILDLKEVRDGNSSINFWVEEPHQDKDGEVVFSGITTGGFSGNKKFLFTLIFHSNKSGAGTIAFKNLQALQNDGLGTKLPVGQTSYTINVSSKFSSGIKEDLTQIDSQPPEDFKPFVSKDANIFDNSYFLVFNTVDKGSGLDHYEVLERPWFLFNFPGGKYLETGSPYLLKDQSLESNIYIKAFDKSGNARKVQIGPGNTLACFLQGFIFVIILVICIYFFRKIRSNFRSS